MVTISMVSYPPESGKELGKRFMELKPMPEFVEMIGPYMFTEIKEGLTAITIYKYDRSKAAEANDAIANAHMAFYGVPGFTYSLKLASGSATSLKMMGLE